MISIFKKPSFILAGIVIILLGVVFAPRVKELLNPPKVHYHAGFVVFQENKKLDFSDAKYMAIEPCVQEGKKVATNEQLEKAHLHDNVGDVVHVEHKGATWQDLFTNIKFPIDYSTTSGYLDGKLVADYQLQPIQPFDSLVVIIGDKNTDLLSQAVTRDYIDEQGKKSKTCGD